MVSPHNQSSCHDQPGTGPNHVAIIMDGNGRWAKRRSLPRMAGHKAGVESVRTVVSACLEKQIGALTLFAFSSENWRRPAQEVEFLLSLFRSLLAKEIEKLNQHQIRIRIIGDRSGFDQNLNDLIDSAEQLTEHNRRLVLNIAFNYGGRWDIVQAAKRLAQAVADNQLSVNQIDAGCFAQQLCLADLPPPDLFIRTSGEQRLSNFLMWQLAYTELVFVDCLWPDFDQVAFEQALYNYSQRVRRFGCTNEQLEVI